MPRCLELFQTSRASYQLSKWPCFFLSSKRILDLFTYIFINTIFSIFFKLKHISKNSLSLLRHTSSSSSTLLRLTSAPTICSCISQPSLPILFSVLGVKDFSRTDFAGARQGKLSWVNVKNRRGRNISPIRGFLFFSSSSAVVGEGLECRCEKREWGVLKLWKGVRILL